MSSISSANDPLFLFSFFRAGIHCSCKHSGMREMRITGQDVVRKWDLKFTLLTDSEESADSMSQQIQLFARNMDFLLESRLGHDFPA